MAKQNGTNAVSLLSVEDILASPDIEEQIVEIPEWGGAVKIRGMSRARLDQLRRMSTIRDKLDEERFQSYIFRECLVDPKLTESQYKALREKPAGPLSRLESRMMEICGLTEREVEKAQNTFQE